MRQNGINGLEFNCRICYTNKGAWLASIRQVQILKARYLNGYKLQKIMETPHRPCFKEEKFSDTGGYQWCFCYQSGKNENVNTETFEKLCRALNCGVPKS
jgi:hypothetical protein